MGRLLCRRVVLLPHCEVAKVSEHGPRLEDPRLAPRSQLLDENLFLAFDA